MLRSALFSFLAVALVACKAEQVPAQGPGQASPQPASTSGLVTVDTVASGLDRPWGLEFLPDGRLLVTENPGRVRIVEPDGTLSAPIRGVPTVVSRGQGGLLDVALDPSFATNRVIYLSYSEPGSDGNVGTSVARAQLGDGELADLRVIYRQTPKVAGGNHFGSRIVFREDGTMFITQGDRANYRDQAQDLLSGLGKIVRINSDGSIPDDNPFVGRSDARPEIWSYGHRNVQSASIDPATGRLWTVEHGANGGDELNQPEAGKNYGWPVISYGREYDGTKIGAGTVKEGMEQPVYYWAPVIAPSGMTFYTGDLFPEWKGSILIGSMKPRGLVRLAMSGGKVVSEERYLGELGERIRDVRQAPDGSVYVITDSPQGRILRLTPSR